MIVRRHFLQGLTGSFLASCAGPGPFRETGLPTAPSPSPVVLVFVSGRANPLLGPPFANHEYLLNHTSSAFASFPEALAAELGENIDVATFISFGPDHVSPVTDRLELGYRALSKWLALEAQRESARHLVVVAHSHGSIALRLALRQVPAIIVDALVDLDSAAFWFDSDHDLDSTDLVEHTASGELVDLDDVVPAQVRYNLEVHAMGAFGTDRSNNQPGVGSKATVQVDEVPFSHSAIWREPAVRDLVLRRLREAGVIASLRQAREPV